MRIERASQPKVGITTTKTKISEVKATISWLWIGGIQAPGRWPGKTTPSPSRNSSRICENRRLLSIDCMISNANNIIKATQLIVETTHYTDVPGEIVAADEKTGECSLCADGEVKTLCFGPAGIKIVERRR